MWCSTTRPAPAWSRFQFLTRFTRDIITAAMPPVTMPMPPAVEMNLPRNGPWRENSLWNIAAQYLGDPEQFWRICDGNRAMRPDELTETIGRRLRITLPAGITGTPNA
jgi:hypothetical protein